MMRAQVLQQVLTPLPGAHLAVPYGCRRHLRGPPPPPIRQATPVTHRLRSRQPLVTPCLSVIPCPSAPEQAAAPASAQPCRKPGSSSKSSHALAASSQRGAASPGRTICFFQTRGEAPDRQQQTPSTPRLCHPLRFKQD